ncbi:four-helix bundle copper-binding protein [Novosphingobium subterraneum]|uniref:Ferredoxin n=1 Tax=Novosphingobium subterraneum TaxID=48936 RepID=A0A0B8ZT69_9SPHN|nr:four-helix bundle copper-binding protein [Novosphingobium subterraneum]KHS49395.1 ferredoxin [Novosphingobium subterraneum]KHS49617.1 ferredoxin [Novosphingobium subterraneum]
MIERRTLLASGTALLASGVASGAVASDGSGHAAAMAMPMKDCIDLCAASHAMCLETANYVASSSRSPASAPLLTLLSDCADACDQCARECEQRRDDPQLTHCAEACRRCAEGCRHMAAMAD